MLLLAGCELREDQLRGAGQGDEDLRGVDLASLRIGDGHRHSGIVDEHHLAGGMDLAQARLERTALRSQLLAEPRVVVPVGVNLPVLEPDLSSGHAAVLGLALNC